MRKFIFKNILTATLVLLSLSARAQTAFDEIFDSSGNVRPLYQEIYQLWKQRHSTSEDAFLIQSRRMFKGDNALDSMPRLIDSTEYDQLKRGVEQRAKAIRAFLKDHYSGRKYYAQAGVLSQDVADRIIARSGEGGYKGQVNPATVSFFYGPDIIKDGNGQWRVIEDNMGFIGGVGDLKLAQDIMLQEYPELKDRYSPRKASEFYMKLAESFKARAQEAGGKAVMYMIPTYAPDNEDKRIAEIFSKLGIETVTPDSVKNLKVRQDGVYLEMKDERGHGTSEKVGFIFMNGEHAWIDPTHPAAAQRNLIEEASGLLKDKKLPSKLKNEIAQALNNTDPVTHLPDLGRLSKLLSKAGYAVDSSIAQKNKGLLDAILKGKVGTNYTPGVDFIGDKEFYVYVEELIRLYLHEEPIIKNIETQKFSENGSNRTNEILLKKVFDNLNEYVIKKVDGRGGDSVWVGPKVKASETHDLIRAIRDNPDLYIVQKFTPLSTMNSNIVDLRVITDVSPKGILVTDTPWGRGLPKDGNGKVNLSDKGREVTVLVVNSRAEVRSCERVFAN